MIHDNGRPPKVVVIGVGNPYRGDDGAGLRVTRLLQSLQLDDVLVVESDGEPAGLTDTWESADLAIVVDAVRAGINGPGYVHRVEVQEDLDLPLTRTISSHGGSPADAVALARALDRLPHRLLIFGIEAASHAPGQTLSPEVEASVDTVAKLVVDELNCRSSTLTARHDPREEEGLPTGRAVRPPGSSPRSSRGGGCADLAGQLG